MSNIAAAELTRYYDEVPYDSHPFPQSSVEHLASRAFLFGLPAPSASGARVLELGCAGGGNLIPFAARFPGASVVGVDLSPVQIAQAISAASCAGLENVDFRVMDIAEIDSSLGKFDYIVCHGVYSWVPESVQDAILRVCSENLTPDGVAYISYNVYPGWKGREIVRDAMLLRGGPRESPEEKLAFGRGMLDFLEAFTKPGSVLQKALEEMMPIIRGANRTYLLHEFYEPFNAPCYFKDFLSRADVHGLTYLAESETSAMFVQNYAQSVQDALLNECGGSQLVMEQYLDFLSNRAFRQTLLVKADKADQIRYRLDPSRLSSMYFTGSYAAANGEPLTLDDQEQDCIACRRSVKLRIATHKAVGLALDAKFPAALSFEELVSDVGAKLDRTPSEIQASVLAMLEELTILGAVWSRRDRPEIAERLSSHPRALDANCRTFQAHPHGQRPTTACNQWQEGAALTAMEVFLMPLVDGSRSQAMLNAEVESAARSGMLQFSKEGLPIQAKDVSLQFILEETMTGLSGLRRKGLLIA